MDNLKGFSLYVFIAVCAVVLIGAILFISELEPRSGSLWDSRIADLDTAEKSLSKRVSDGTARNGRVKATNSYGGVRPNRQAEILRKRLARKSAQYDALKAKVDALRVLLQTESDQPESLAFLSDQLGIWIEDVENSIVEPQIPGDADRVADGEGIDQGVPQPLDEGPQSELESLKEKLRIAEFEDALQKDELESLKELQTAAERNQEQTAAESATRLAQHRDLESEASRALIRVGATAVPFLADALDDNRAYVREWAADVLGAIGPDASDAIPSLIDALADTDQSVRLAAGQALNEIEERESRDR